MERAGRRPLTCLTRQRYSVTLFLPNDSFPELLTRSDAVTREEILAKVAAGEIPVEEASKLLEKADQAKKGSLY